MRHFLPPYRRYLAQSIVFNILSAALNIFSFAALIPILQILFKTGDAENATALMALGDGDIKEVMMNNMNFYVNRLIDSIGPSTTLLCIGLFLAFTTFLKTSCYFLSSADIREKEEEVGVFSRFSVDQSLQRAPKAPRGRARAAPRPVRRRSRPAQASPRGARRDFPRRIFDRLLHLAAGSRSQIASPGGYVHGTRPRRAQNALPRSA